MPTVDEILKKKGKENQNQNKTIKAVKSLSEGKSLLETLFPKYFKPTPEVRVRDVVREVPGEVKEVAKDLVRGSARVGDFLGRKIQQPIGKVLFGIDSEAMRKANPQPKAESFIFGEEGRQDSLKGLGQSEFGIDKEKQPLLATLGGIGATALELPITKGAKGGVKALTKTLGKSGFDELFSFMVKANKGTDIAPKLVELGVDEKIAKKAGDKLAKIDDPKKVTRELEGLKFAEKPKPKVSLKGNPIEVAKRLGFESFVDDVGGDDSAKDIAGMFWSKKAEPNTFYHVTPDEKFVDFDRAKAGERYTERGGGISEAKGLYVGKDPEALTNFYGMDQDVNVIKFKGEPRLMDLVSKADEEKFLAEVQSKYGIKNTTDKEFGQAIEKEIIEQGYDGVRYFDPYATGEEFLIVNPKALKAVNVRGKAPAEAFGVVAGVETDEEGNVQFDPLKGLLGVAGAGALKKVGAEKNVDEAVDTLKTGLKELSPRRLKDTLEAGINEDLMSKYLYARTGGPLSHKEAQAYAEKLSAPINDLLTGKTLQLDAKQLTAYSQELTGYRKEVVETLKAQTLAHPDDEVLKQQYLKAVDTYTKATAGFEAAGTEAGRVVESLKTFGHTSRVPGMNNRIKQVRNNIKGYADKKNRPDLLVDFDMALDGVDINNPTELLDFLTQWNKASFLQKLSEYQKASLLSAFSTHAVNAMGNAIQQLIDVPTRLLAGTIDAGKSAVTGSKREVFAGEAKQQISGAMRAMPEAIMHAVKALGDEHYAYQLKRTEIEAGTPVPAIKGNLGKVIRLPFRLLQAADLGFRTLKKGAETKALTHRVAKQEGLSGQAYKKRVAELKDKTPDEILDAVDERAERSLMLEDMTGVLKTIEDAKNKHPAVQFVIPFYRTLVNLTREAYRMTPIGGMGRTVGRVIPDRLGGKKVLDFFSNKWTEDNTTKTEELSRQIIGTSIMTWVVMGMLNDDIEITGATPSDAGERQVFYGQGKLPHSIRVGDKWIEFQRVQPIGQLLQLGSSLAQVIDAYKNTGKLSSEEVGQEAGEIISNIADMVLDQSPFTGFTNLVDLIQGGAYNEGYLKAGERYGGQLVGTFIPNLLRRTTVANDPTIYEKREFMDQAVKSRIPGMQGDLTPKRDIFGEKVEQSGNFMSRFASPVRTSEVSENELYDEMDRVGYRARPPQRRAYGENLSEKEYETLMKFYGPRFRDEIRKRIESPSYQNLNDEQKRANLEKISQITLRVAKGKLFPLYQEQDKLRKQWTDQGFTGREIEKAMDQRFPWTKSEMETYVEKLLQRELEPGGQARRTVNDILNP